MLRQGKVGAAKLSLKKNGFALPHYSDSAKVAYVLQGSGVGGVVLRVPQKEEKLVGIKKGDAIALPHRAITWWYNKDDTDLVVLFLGNTIKAHKPGSFTNFFLTGKNSILTGFSTEFLGRAWDLDEGDVKSLVESQKGHGIVKIDPSWKMPEAREEDYNGMAVNCEEVASDVKMVSLNSDNLPLPLLGQVGVWANLVRMRSRGMVYPGYSSDSAVAVSYVTRGSGHIEIEGMDGKRVLGTTLKAGDLFVVPRFFIVSVAAGAQGMELFSLATIPN